MMKRDFPSAPGSSRRQLERLRFERLLHQMEAQACMQLVIYTYTHSDTSILVSVSGYWATNGTATCTFVYSALEANTHNTHL